MNKRPSPFPPYILSRISRILSLSRLTSFLAFLALFLFPPFSPFSLSFASDEPFTYPANWGGTGLMEIPTARIMRKDSFRAGVAQVNPYRFYYGATSPLKNIEIDGRITELLEVPSNLSNQKNAKDKVVDFKYQFVSEGKFMPALAIGIMDPHGNRLYPSQYIVASKQVYPFDFTIGIGNGRFGKKPLISRTDDVKMEILTDPESWLKDSQFFGGIQFAPSEKFALMVEYSPIMYHKQTGDPAQDRHFTDPVPSKFNFGVRYKPTKWSDIDISYQRGEQIGINLSVAFDLGKPLVPLYDRVYRETPFDISNTLPDRITRVLQNSGFSDIGILLDGSEIWIEAQNDKYFYNTRAIGIILKILMEILPENIRDVHIILKENGIPAVRLSTIRQDIIDLYAEKLTLNEFLQLAQVQTDLDDTLHAEGRHKKTFKYGYKPDFQSYLHSREGFFKYRLGLSGWGSYHPWKGASYIAGLEWFPFNTVPVENVDDSSIPVRSDIALYKSENVALSRLMFDQVKKLTPHIYGKFSAGLLEVQYAGIDAEVAMPVLNGRVFLGLGGSAVKKRDPGNPFKIKSEDVKELYTTAFFNTRLNVPEQGIAVDVKAGRFLAGDKGVRFTVSKHIKGVILWAWFSFTDTSIFSDSINEGYRDKGIGISIPLRLFKGTDSKTAYVYSLSAWTRDTGQDINHFNSLFDQIGRNTKIFIDKDKKMLLYRRNK